MDEEINFFEYPKPVIVLKLIYNAIYKIETRKPYVDKRIRKYFVKELKKLKGSLTIILIFTRITGVIILSLKRSFLCAVNTI